MQRPQHHVNAQMCGLFKTAAEADDFLAISREVGPVYEMTAVRRNDRLSFL
jgi:hypothetical protein